MSLGFRRRPLLIVVGVVIATAVTFPAVAAETPVDSSPFGDDLETVRRVLRIPGMSVAVVQDQSVVFADGFGFADEERQIPAGPDTPYGLASVTKPIAATLVMQLVEEGFIDLDVPVSTYGVTVPGAPDVTARHLLTHTSEGVPGTVHEYNGNRYGLLGGVVQGATGRSFAAELGERILQPLEMTDTALGPLDAWQGPAPNGLDAFRRTLGWGRAYEHYPDVYRRLARPYQFSEDYSIIPGMYHLEHSPAAGLSSSVEDLATFDVALDRGLLLGDGSKTAMLTAAYPIPGSHPGCAYGLGWYVQEFQGTTIQWHTGRWPPSTSGLYLRFPDYRLSFIVLANTDNLTVPFNGLGNGDVMTSVLALIFYRHYLFAEIHGYELPDVDWSGTVTEIEAQLAGVDGEAAREFLERELWAFRQAYASSGQESQVRALGDADLALYPNSTFRFDPIFTGLAGDPSVVAPVLDARTLVSISWFVLTWLVLVVLGLFWMTWILARRLVSPFSWVLWMVATVFIGPIAPAVHRLTRPESPDARPWQLALDASLASIAGYSLAWTGVIAALLSLGDDANAAILLAIYLTVFGVGLLAMRGPLLQQGGILSYTRAVRQGVVGELITVNLGVGVLFALTLWFDNRILSLIPFPTSPYFWGMMAAIATVGMLVLWPVQRWILRRGFFVWPTGDAATSLRLPSWRDSWWMALTTLVLMALLIGIAAVLTG